MSPERTNVEVTDEFRTWWDSLGIRDQRAVAKVVDALVQRGPRLQYPHSSGIKGSRHPHMRELRVRTRPPIRVLYAFDPYRTAILLTAGRKTDSERFYREYTRRADAIYDEYIGELQEERKRDGTVRGSGR